MAHSDNDDDELPFLDLVDNPVIRRSVRIKPGQFMRQRFSFVRILNEGIDRFLDDFSDRCVELIDSFFGLSRE